MLYPYPLVKSHALHIFFWTPLDGGVIVLWKLFFDKNLILHVKTTLRLQKPHCENFWILKMKVVSTNNKQKAKNCENEQEIVKNGFMFNFYSKLIQ